MSKEKAEFTKFDCESNWVHGKCGKYRFVAKLFNVGSDYGIDCGRVSKLSIDNANGNNFINYDRGWSTASGEKPKMNAGLLHAYKQIMSLLENAPQRDL